MNIKTKRLLILVGVIYVVGNFITQMNLVQQIADINHRVAHLEGLKDHHNH